MSRYNANVRIGNWFDNLIMQEEILKQYLRRNAKSELKVLKARKLFSSLLVEVPLTVPVQGLSFGAAVQIMSKDSPTSDKFNLKKNQGMVLSANIEHSKIDERSTFSFGDQVIATGLLNSCMRNVWTLIPCDPSLNNKPIRFGDNFYIRLYDSKLSLYVDAPLSRPMLPVGECGQVVPKLTGSPNNNTRFKVVHINSNVRYETEGQIVPPYERVVLLQCCSGEALAIECDSWIPTYFGMECEVSVKNYFVDSKIPRKHDFRNFWEKRQACLDLQTFTVHFPASRYKAVSLGKTGNYPVALIPGQNTDFYKEYTSTELKYFPLNTVLYGPVRPNSRRFIRAGSDGSQSDSDDSTSSDDSSSSSSEETQDTETSSTVDDESASDVKPEKEKIVEKQEEKPAPEKKGRGRPLGSGKKSNSQNPDQPKKRLGRPPKVRPPLPVATVNLKKLEDEDPSFVKSEIEKLQNSTCKMCHEEESKNKNGEFERFINCSQCKGKIHPSCIDLTAEMIPKITSYGWQCTDCKSCVRCDQSSSEDKMIFCDQCDRGYHIFCVGLKKVPSGNYICNECKPVSTPGSSAPEGGDGDETIVKEEEEDDEDEEDDDEGDGDGDEEDAEGEKKESEEMKAEV